MRIQSFCFLLSFATDKTKEIQPTIAEKNNSTVVPGVKDLLLQHDLRDPSLGRSVNEVPNRHNSSAVLNRHLEVSDLFAHGLRSLRTPLHIAEGVVLPRGVFVQKLDDTPADGVLGSDIIGPLQRCRQVWTRDVINRILHDPVHELFVHL